MARLGAISLFEQSSSLQSGVAFSLTSSATTDAVLAFANAEIEVRAGQRDVVVRFSKAVDPKTAFDEGHRLAQQGLDLLSILGRVDAVIQDAENDHLIWWAVPSGVALRQVSTIVLPFSVGHVTLTVRDQHGNIVPPIQIQPQHHIAFRYYRLAQTTDDLYDAYRNMYLAFEVLLSTRFPITKGEKEIIWLRRALAGCQPDIRLDDLGPQSSDIIESILNAVYHDARLPLFHAKEGKEFFPPHDSNSDRQIVSNALRILTHLVLRMAGAWFSAVRTGGGVFFGWVYESIQQLLSTSCLVATNCSDPFQPSEPNLAHERFRSAVKFKTNIAPEFQREGEPAIFGTVSGYELRMLGEIWRIELISPDRPRMALTFESPLTCDDAERLEVLMHVRATNLTQSKTLFRR